MKVQKQLYIGSCWHFVASRRKNHSSEINPTIDNCLGYAGYAGYGYAWLIVSLYLCLFSPGAVAALAEGRWRLAEP